MFRAQLQQPQWAMQQRRARLRQVRGQFTFDVHLDARLDLFHAAIRHRREQQRPHLQLEPRLRTAGADAALSLRP